MSLFDRLVEDVLRRAPELGVLRPVVEKEVLHHDILQALHRTGVLKELVFMGGTCLRACYGSQRLSEDLDFYGGPDFTPDRLAALPEHLSFVILNKYGLNLVVRGPRREESNVRAWSVTIQTSPERPDLPSQRIHLDICLLAARDTRPMMLRNV